MTFVIPTIRVANFPPGAVVDDRDIRGDPIRGRVAEPVRVANLAAILIINTGGCDE